jgi:hypothetical protein
LVAYCRWKNHQRLATRPSFISASGGLTGKVTTLLSQAAELAIRQKVECITADLIDQAAASGTYKRRPADVESEM